jgi:hypothetical protein
MTATDELMTVEQILAELRGVSRRTFYRWREIGTAKSKALMGVWGRASDTSPLPIFRAGLAVACTGLSSGWQIGVSLNLAYI